MSAARSLTLNCCSASSWSSVFAFIILCCRKQISCSMSFSSLHTCARIKVRRMSESLMYSTGVCRVSESLMYSIGVCRVSKSLKYSSWVCRVSKSLIYSTAWSHMCMCTPYTAAANPSPAPRLFHGWPPRVAAHTWVMAHIWISHVALSCPRFSWLAN